MRAWVVREWGAAVLEDVADPELSGDEHDVLLQVDGTSVMFADGLLVKGEYQERPELPFVPGMEVAGTVLESNSSTWSPGDQVVGLVRPGIGSWAERAVADGRQLVARPDDIDVDAALGVHVNAQTAWFCLHRAARVRPGEVVLVHAAAGGVGSMAVQLALDAGARVIATSSPSKRDVVEGLGELTWLDNRDEGWADTARELIGGVDVVVDVVGGSVFEQSWKLLNFEGRMVTAGFASGDIPTVKVNHTLVKNVSLIGIYWARYTTEATAEVRHAAEQIWDVYRAGNLDPLVTDGGGLEDAWARSQELSGGSTIGKIVLRW